MKSAQPFPIPQWQQNSSFLDNLISNLARLSGFLIVFVLLVEVPDQFVTRDLVWALRLKSVAKQMYTLHNNLNSHSASSFDHFIIILSSSSIQQTFSGI